MDLSAPSSGLGEDSDALQRVQQLLQAQVDARNMDSIADNLKAAKVRWADGRLGGRESKGLVWFAEEGSVW